MAKKTDQEKMMRLLQPLKLQPEWRLRSDLTLMEAGYMLMDLDPITHARRLNEDSAYLEYADNIGIDEQAYTHAELLYQEAEHGHNLLVLLPTITDGAKISECRVSKNAFMAWCTEKGLEKVAKALLKTLPPSGAAPEMTPAERRELLLRRHEELVASGTHKPTMILAEELDVSDRRVRDLLKEAREADQGKIGSGFAAQLMAAMPKKR